MAYPITDEMVDGDNGTRSSRFERGVVFWSPSLGIRVSRFVHATLPQTMPMFPWPPPRATAFQTMPENLVTSGAGDSLGLVFDRLRTALGHVDIGWWSVYAIGNDGFAIVTRMETIDADGRPRPLPDRWSFPRERLPSTFSGLGAYLKALFFARPGFYRIIVLLVTARPLSWSEAPLTADSAIKLVASGTDQLPAELRRTTLPASGRSVALIYEFSRPAEDEPARFLATSEVGPARHLALAGLWSEEDLRK